jgi:hypothetical protein
MEEITTGAMAAQLQDASGRYLLQSLCQRPIFASIIAAAEFSECNDMCGIAGFILTRRVPNAESRLRAVADSIRHRGPEGEGWRSW